MTKTQQIKSILNTLDYNTYLDTFTAKLVVKLVKQNFDWKNLENWKLQTTVEYVAKEVSQTAFKKYTTIRIRTNKELSEYFFVLEITFNA
jgi:hypothetical protein